MEVAGPNGQNYKKGKLAQCLIERLQGNIPVYFPELRHRDFSVKTVSLGGEYAQTFRFDVDASSFNKVIFVKLCPVFGNLNPAVMEYETLQILYGALPKINERYAVARPLDFFDDLNGYAMESVGTKNFKPLLLRFNSRLCGAKSLAQLMENISGCGAWLKAFHEVTKKSSVSFKLSAYLGAIREDFDYHGLVSFGFQQATLQRLNAMFSSLARLDGFALPCAKWHWDFTPAHVFLDQGRISVIDITGIDDTPIYEDIGHFLAALVTVNNLPFYPFYDRQRADDLLCNTFMAAYFDRVPERDCLLFSNIYKLKYLLLWFNAQHLRVHQRLPSFVAQLFAKYRLTRLFEGPLLRAVDSIESAL